MNTHLKNVKLLVKGKPAQQLDTISIRGSNIRYKWPRHLVPENFRYDFLSTSANSRCSAMPKLGESSAGFSRSLPWPG